MSPVSASGYSRKREEREGICIYIKAAGPASGGHAAEIAPEELLHPVGIAVAGGGGIGGLLLSVLGGGRGGLGLIHGTAEGEVRGVGTRKHSELV